MSWDFTSAAGAASSRGKTPERVTSGCGTARFAGRGTGAREPINGEGGQQRDWGWVSNLFAFVCGVGGGGLGSGAAGDERWDWLARRYHWHSAAVKDFVCEPHTAIVGENEGRDSEFGGSAGAQMRRRRC